MEVSFAVFLTIKILLPFQLVVLAGAPHLTAGYQLLSVVSSLPSIPMEFSPSLLLAAIAAWGLIAWTSYQADRLDDRRAEAN
jgi:hypothetical protein